MKQLTARNSRVSHHDAMMALVPGVGVWQYDLANQQETWDAVLLELLGFENEEPRPELFNRLRDVDRERLRTAIAGARVDRTPFDLVFAIESKTTVKRIRIRGGFDSRSPEIVRCVCIPEHASEEGSGRSHLVFPAASRFHASHGEAAFVADEDQRLDAGTNATGQEAFFVLRLDVQGKILNFNPCFQHLTDYRLDEVRDKHWFDLFDNLSGSESRNQFDTGHGGGKGEADLPQSLVRTRLRTRNGSIKEVQWVTESLFDQAGRITGYYVIGNDAASHLELEEETRLERLIASKIQSAVFVVRVRDFEILYVNPRAIDLLSYRKDRLVGARMDQLLFGGEVEVRERLSIACGKAIESGFWEGSLDFVSSQQETKRLPTTITILEHEDGGYLAVIRSDERQGKAAACAVEPQVGTNFQNQLEHSPLPIYLWQKIDNEDDFRLVQFNRAAELCSKGTIRDAMGIRLSEFAAHAPSVIEDYRRVARTKTTFRREMPCVLDGSESGRFVDVLYTFVPPNYVMVQTDDITDRKRSELKLKRTNARLERVLQHAPVLVCGVDEDLNIEFWNKECERVTGFSKEEVTGVDRGWMVLFPNVMTQVDMLKQWRKVAGNYRHWQLPITCKNGATRIISWSSISAKVPIEGWADWSVGVDVTDQVQAESHLRESEERLRLALSGAKQGLWDLDIPSGVARVSEHYWAMLGYDELDQVQTIRRWLESIHPDDLDSTSEKFRSFVAGEIDQYVSEFRLRTRDGGYRWMLSAGEIVSRDQFGRPLRMVGTHVDISELKQAQLRLRETTERYRILFEQCPDAILIVDIASHRILESNSAFESILGYSREEALQLTLEDLEAKESPEDVVSHVKQMATRGSDRFETRLRCKDGRVIDVLTHVRVIELGGKKRFHSVLRDITAQKTAERNLRQILESCFGFIGLYDLEGNLIEVNQAPLDVAGISREEVIGKPVWKSKWWNYSPQSQEQLRDVIRRASLGERVRFESTMRSRQGRFVSVDVVFGPVRNASDQVSHVVSFGVDVTDVKRTQTLLEKSEQFVRSVLDSLDDPLAVIDRQGTVVHANRRWKQTASVSHELIFESEGGSYLATCERKSRDGSQYAFQIASALRSLFNGESVGFSFEYSVERANEVRSYVCRGRRIMTSESVAAKVMHTDVTAIKHAEIERERLLNQLAHAGRVAVMGETTAGVAHELNQPLAAIRLYADNCVAGMAQGTISPPVMRDHLAEIARLAGMSGDIIRRILRFARKSPTNSTIVNLNELVHAATRFVSHDLRLNQINIDLQLPTEPVLVFGDSVQLQQVLLNLLKNAIESYTDQFAEKRQIEISVALDDYHAAEVRIRDFGRPIGPEESQRLREPFFTTKESGLGMGLKISDSIIHAHGGELTWADEEDGGKVFSVTIPSHKRGL